jgi:carbon-monoxide dehydrogenase medium subunit
MIPAAFDYVRASSADEAVKLLSSASGGDEAKLLAGGHSLLPLMKLRLATPSLLVDVGEIADLSYVRDEGDVVAIGSMTKHMDVEASEVLARSAPLLSHVAGQVGDPQVRHRGTIGGSLAHGDPASDLPAALLALRASLVVLGPGGQRVVAIDDFFTGFLETALAADEVLLEIRVPKADGSPWSFQKFHRRAMDWAIVGVACVRTNGSCGVGLVNIGSTPLRAAAVESAVSGGASAAEAAAVADQGTSPPTDLNASPEYRRHLAQVLVRRALEEASR